MQNKTFTIGRYIYTEGRILSASDEGSCPTCGSRGIRGDYIVAVYDRVGRPIEGNFCCPACAFRYTRLVEPRNLSAKQAA